MGRVGGRERDEGLYDDTYDRDAGYMNNEI